MFNIGRNDQEEYIDSRSNVINLDERRGGDRASYTQERMHIEKENAFCGEYDNVEDVLNPEVTDSDREELADRIDVLPGSTTMQFKGKNKNYIYEDYDDDVLDISEEGEDQYKINTKGKIMIAVYAIVVLTIFTLIIMNTRLLKSMNENIADQEAQVEILKVETEQLTSKLEFVSSDEEIIRQAEEVYNMVKVNR